MRHKPQSKYVSPRSRAKAFARRPKLTLNSFTVYVTRGILNRPRYVVWQGRQFVKIVQDSKQAFAEYLQACGD